MVKVFDIQQLIQKGLNDDLSQLLQEKPSLANEFTPQGISLLQFAAYCRNQEAINLLVAYKESLNLYEAVCIGNNEIVQTHIESDSGIVHQPSPDGFSSLGLACFFGQEAIAAYLISEGADVNQPSENNFKVTPLHSAVAIGNYDLCKLLLEHGADPNARQQQGVTPLHSAAHNGFTSITQLLIDHGADVHAVMESGQTPLMMAEEASFSVTAKLLKEYANSTKLMTYVAFLRGINVGGHRKIKMQDLQFSLARMGLNNVKTYIQSGNIVFSASENKADYLSKEIEVSIEKDFGFEVKVIVKNGAQLKEIITKNPYLSDESADISKCYLTLLTDISKKEQAELLSALKFPHDEFHLMDDIIYLYCTNGYGKTKLSNDFFEKKLKQPATTRNWKTMLKMLEISENAN
ncbi:DUF1697 domain-containing protein [Catalinimonas sp. 4WD22]|uniref:DUF1697 domain-containing protein n=1 Tax=Catalinimonas locisalis TaxID=3133978 RepID=UPI0031013506